MSKAVLKPPPCEPWPDVLTSANHPLVYLQGPFDGFFHGAIAQRADDSLVIEKGLSIEASELASFLGAAAERNMSVVFNPRARTPPCPFPPKDEFLRELNEHRKGLAEVLRAEARLPRVPEPATSC